MSNNQTKDVVNDNLEDIKEGVHIYLRDSYYRGFEDGAESQSRLTEKLADPTNILKDFMSFIKQYKMVNFNGEIKFSNNDYVYMDENLINLFLLKYDYENTPRT